MVEYNQDGIFLAKRFVEDINHFLERDILSQCSVDKSDIYAAWSMLIQEGYKNNPMYLLPHRHIFKCEFENIKTSQDYEIVMEDIDNIISRLGNVIDITKVYEHIKNYYTHIYHEPWPDGITREQASFLVNAGVKLKLLDTKAQTLLLMLHDYEMHWYVQTTLGMDIASINIKCSIQPQLKVKGIFSPLGKRYIDGKIHISRNDKRLDTMSDALLMACLWTSHNDREPFGEFLYNTGSIAQSMRMSPWRFSHKDGLIMIDELDLEGALGLSYNPHSTTTSCVGVLNNEEEEINFDDLTLLKDKVLQIIPFYCSFSDMYLYMKHLFLDKDDDKVKELQEEYTIVATEMAWQN